MSTDQKNPERKKPGPKPRAQLASQPEGTGPDYKHRAMFSQRNSRSSTAPKPPKPKTDPSVLVVRAGRVLLWPNGEVRGKEGYAVSIKDPFIEDYLGVLAPAPVGTTPEPIDHPIYVAELKNKARKAMTKNAPRAKREPKEVPVAIEDPDEGDDELPDPEA